MATEKTELDIYVDHQLEKISPYKAKSIDLKIDAELQEVTDAESAKEAAALRKQITKHKSDTEEARKKITRQFDAVTKQFIKHEKEVLKPAEEAQAIIQKKLLDYEAAEAKRQAAEQERVQEIVSRFDALMAANADTTEAINEQLARMEVIADSLSPDDRTNPVVNLAIAKTKSSLLQQKDDLTLGAETDDAEMGEVAAALGVAAEDAEKSLKDASKSVAKVGIKTVTKFEIDEPQLVPAIYCEPSEKLIREAIKRGVDDIAGVRMWHERSF